MQKRGRRSSVSVLVGSALSRIWHGEISLYRAAYGLGGLGLAIASLLGDSVQDAAAAVGHASGLLLWSLASAGEILVAWLAWLATVACGAPRSGARPLAVVTARWRSGSRSPLSARSSS